MLTRICARHFIMAALLLSAMNCALASQPLPPVPTARIELSAVVSPEATDARVVSGPTHTQLHVSSTPFATTQDIASVAQATDSEGHPVLDLQFRAEVAAKISAYSQAHVGQQIAFMVAGQVYTTAYIAGPFSSSMRVSALGDAALQRALFEQMTGADH